MITVGEHGPVAQRNNVIMRFVKSVFVWNLGSLPQVILGMEVISCPESYEVLQNDPVLQARG